MRLQILNFKGAVPRMHPRLLPENFGQTASNTRLEDGSLGPIRAPRAEYTFGAAVQTIYRDGATWLGWNAVVDVAPAPVAASRLYYTGDGAPKVRDSGTVYGLALTAPAAAPTLTALSTPDPAAQETVLYCYTFITSLGEESAPSPLASVTWSPGVTIRLSAFSAAPGSRAVTGRRIYRSQTSAAGITSLYFVAEIAFPATYDHDLAAAPLQEPLPTIDFDTPSAGLIGLTAMPNGMMAAFEGKEVFFSEPYQPHAWPSKYALAVDYPIVGLSAFGSILAILTTGTPYIAQGTHPKSMVLEKMDRSLPCLSRRAIVDIGYACYFPSTDGLAVLSATDAQIVTRNLFTREQWQLMSPATFVANAYDGRYLFTFTSDVFDALDGLAPDGVGLPADYLDGGAPSGGAVSLSYDFGSPTSAFGSQRLGSIDIAGELPFFIDADVILPATMFADRGSGELFMLEGTTVVKEWDDPAGTPATQTWRSKVFQLPFPTNFGAALVETDAPIGAGDAFACYVFADGLLVDTITTVNEPVRLTSGYLAKRWEVEIVTNIAVSGVTVASTMDEVAG